MASRAPRSSQGDERDFLAAYDPSRFERPSVAVDVSILTVRDGRLVCFLLQRREHPFRNRYALPFGFVRMQESLHDAALRVLSEKSGVKNVYIEQLFTFGGPERDPRMRVISVAHYALLDAARLEALVQRRPQGVALAELEVPWEGETGGAVRASIDGRPIRLAFDHAEQLGMAVRRLRGKLSYAPIGFQLLPERFTLRELQRVHEAVQGLSLNKDSFRRKVLASGQLETTGDVQADVDHRPAELYRFRERSAL